MRLQKIIKYLLLLFLFLLPWQTRWIYAPAYINGGWWEYGTESIFATQILLWLIIILFLIDRVKNRGTKMDFGNPQNLMLAFWLGGVGQGLLAIWQFLSQFAFANKWLGLASHAAINFNGDFVIETASGRWLRAYGAFGSPNTLGGFLAVCLVMGLIVYLRFEKGERQFAPTRDWRRGVLLYALMAGQLTILFGLILSFSRGAWIATGVGVVVAFVVGAIHESPLQAIGRQLILYLLVIIFFLITLQPIFTARLTGEGRLEQRSISERLSQMSDFKSVWWPDFYAFPGIISAPEDLMPYSFAERLPTLFFGVGPGNYTRTLYAQSNWRPANEYQPIHNTYLLILAEVGFVGFLFFAIILYYIFKELRKNPIFLSLIAVILVSALFDHFWWSLYSGRVIWLAVIGLCLI